MKYITTVSIIFIFLIFLNSGCQKSYVERVSEEREIKLGKYLELETRFEPPLDSYYNKVRILFANGYDQNVVFRMICIPSFSNEWLVGIRKINGTYSAFVIRPETHIWATEVIPMYESGEITRLVDDEEGNVETQIDSEAITQLKNEVPTDFRDIVISEDAVAIDTDTAKLLSDIWFHMLLAARNHDKSDITDGDVTYTTIRIDGINYYFSMNVPNHGELKGSTYTPSPKTRTGMLTSLGELLVKYIDATIEEREAIIIEINQTAKKLEKQFKNSQQMH